MNTVVGATPPLYLDDTTPAPEGAVLAMFTGLGVLVCAIMLSAWWAAR